VLLSNALDDLGPLAGGADGRSQAQVLAPRLKTVSVSVASVQKINDDRC
jgi:hypothetical protein